MTSQDEFQQAMHDIYKFSPLIGLEGRHIMENCRKPHKESAVFDNRLATRDEVVWTSVSVIKQTSGAVGVGRSDRRSQLAPTVTRLNSFQVHQQTRQTDLRQARLTTTRDLSGHFQVGRDTSSHLTSPHLTSVTGQALLQGWVKRLAGAGSGSEHQDHERERALDYARYLAYQLQRAQLRFPFSQPPGKGPLPDLKDVLVSHTRPTADVYTTAK